MVVNPHLGQRHSDGNHPGAGRKPHPPAGGAEIMLIYFFVQTCAKCVGQPSEYRAGFGLKQPVYLKGFTADIKKFNFGCHFLFLSVLFLT
jgi:hypothetical protein